jgi:hypothetical protein
MTRTGVLERARSAIGHGTIYRLGMGGFNPASPHPWNSRGECDCSGFIAWCLGVSRYTDHPWYSAQNGGWLETTAIIRDALKEGFGMFDQVALEQALPGDLVVYGDRDGHQGHVGLISHVEPAGEGVEEGEPKAIIHCSKGNWVAFQDAINETGNVGAWRMHGAVVARYVELVLP